MPYKPTLPKSIQALAPVIAPDPAAEAREHLATARAACLDELAANRAAALERARVDWDAEPPAIEPGWWHLGEPPEPPPAPEDGQNAEYWDWLPAHGVPPIVTILPGCRETLFAAPSVYPPGPTREQAMARLENFLAAVKAHREQVDDAREDGDELARLEYLRGPMGQHDRETIWRGGLGRLPGTGEGGFKIGWQPFDEWAAAGANA